MSFLRVSRGLDRKGASLALFSLAVAASLVGASPASARAPEDDVQTTSLIGSYLAGRFARADHETGKAATFYKSALARDRDSDVLLEQAFLMDASEGNWPDALKLAERLVAKQPKHRMSHLVLGLAAFQENSHEKAAKHFKAAGSGPIGELTSLIARAWVEQAQGRTARALELLKSRRQADWAQFYLSYHAALISDMAGRSGEARAAYEKIFRQDSRTLRTALAYARHAAASGDFARAKTILRTHLRAAQGDGHPLARDMLDRLSRGEGYKLLVRTPVEGLSEVFYGLGEALTGEGGVSIGILYLQMALFLQPDQAFALAALANAHEATKRYDEAISTYDRIPRGSALEQAIDIRKAFNLNSLERTDEARDLLDAVAKSNPADVKPLDALGNIMRSRKRYDEAVDYYTRVISLIGKPEERDWVYYYSRGTSYERLKRWPEAEADLMQALKLSPDQPLALNYLGYSWIDRGRNLREGMKLIEKAVSLKPDDGYIVDSLGWAHFRLGHYEKAVTHLERAVELRPEDPVLNDHLGDAYWQVGRAREARFQWDQALSLNPEPEDLEKIKKKLAEGLPVKRQAAVDGDLQAQPPAPELPLPTAGNQSVPDVPAPVRRTVE
ncbi:MAG: tetratricopeptide repeat protein [Hyphomicrobiaceae bacterium]|nr:tetratricopeptide repeat protein [Hyphomicrobiaceae bacterium]